VLASLRLMTGRSFRVAEAAVRVRLLIRVAEPPGQCESVVMPGPGLGGIPCGTEDLAEQVERFGPVGKVAGLVADGDGVL
jgi:hypothetical protein